MRVHRLRFTVRQLLYAVSVASLLGAVAVFCLKERYQDAIAMRSLWNEGATFQEVTQHPSHITVGDVDQSLWQAWTANPSGITFHGMSKLEGGEQLGKLNTIESVAFVNCEIREDDFQDVLLLSNLDTALFTRCTIQPAASAFFDLLRVKHALFFQSNVPNEVFSALADNTHLSHLDLMGVSLDRNGIAELARSPKLTELTVGATTIDAPIAQEFKSLKTLEVLRLDVAHLNNKALNFLIRLDHLDRIELLNCSGVTPAWVQELRQALPEAKVSVVPDVLPGAASRETIKN